MISYKIILFSLCWYLSVATEANFKNESANFSTDANSTESSFPWPHYRLPATHFPDHYYVFIYPHPENDTFSGTVTIELQARNSSEWVIMNQNTLNIRKIVLTLFNSTRELRNYFISDDYQILALKLPTDMVIPSSKHFNLTIHYDGEIGDETVGGLYKGWYTDEDGLTEK